MILDNEINFIPRTSYYKNGFSDTENEQTSKVCDSCCREKCLNERAIESFFEIDIRGKMEYPLSLMLLWKLWYSFFFRLVFLLLFLLLFFSQIIKWDNAAVGKGCIFLCFIAKWKSLYYYIWNVLYFKDG